MAFLDRLKQGLSKTRDFLSQGINRISAALGYYDEEQLEELEELLIQADLGIPAATQLMDQVRQDIQRQSDASSAAVLASLRKGILEQLGSARSLPFESGRLNIYLLIGVNGTGKTTTCGKLAARFHQQGRSVLIAAADTFRAAAIDQLQHWAERTQTPCIASKEGADPASVVYDSVQAALARKTDVLLIDTAGRLHNKKNLMDELAKLRRIVSREAPEARVESLLVLDANTGQNAVSQARLFQEPAALTGLIVTKLDGNAKGGVAVAIAGETKLPIYLIGVGEAVEDLQDFDPVAFADALLPKQNEEG